MMAMRFEKDSLGQKEVPLNVLYGIQTLRAVENFPISQRTIGEIPFFIRSLAEVKKAAARANYEVGQLSEEKSKIICEVCEELIEGKWSEAFPVDQLQGGAGTSSNMNINEVIANRGLQLMGHSFGDYEKLHPNDDVNKSQSTNDSFATAVRLSLYYASDELISALQLLAFRFDQKSKQFSNIAKLGRTQLQDAVPMTVGAELSAYAVTISEDIERLLELREFLLEVNMGGTAIGSGIGASEEYIEKIIPHLADVTALPIKRGKSLFEASWDMGAFVLFSGLLKRVAVKQSKIANDMRLLSSGPAGGIGEYGLPTLQPGSSIMPGKVNPVIAEALNQVCFKAFGADATVTFAAEGGQLQLNAFEPVILQALSETIELLVSAIRNFADKCIGQLSVDEWRCQDNLVKSTALATRLIGVIGYDKSAQLAKAASGSGLSFKAFISLNHPDLLRHIQI